MSAIKEMQFTLPRIYPITDKILSGKTSHLSIVKELVRGGARLIQVRDKSTPDKELLRDLKQCAEFASKSGITLIADNRCDLVLSSHAMGVHLGQEDLPPKAARTILGPKKIIGFSTHTFEQIKKSFDLPIQYIGFGPVYATTTKRNTHPAVGVQRLAKACKMSAVPVVAIGGIDLDHVLEVLEAGAASAAVIAALMKAGNLARQMQRFLEKAMEK